MSSPTSDLSVLQVNLLCAVVAASGSTATEIGEVAESVYGIEIPRSRVYNHVSRLTALGLIEKSEPRGALGKSITPTEAGAELTTGRYDWLVDRMREEADV